MPHAAIAGIAAAVGGALGTIAGSSMVAAWAYAGVYAATYAAGAYLLNKAAEALAPDVPKGKGAGYEVNYSGTDVRRKIIYGEVRIGGMQTIPPVTSGTEGRYLHFLLTLAGHECESITDVWFDRDQIATADIGAISGTDDDGLVGGSSKYADIAWIRRYTGTASQTVDYILNQAFPTEFSSDFRGRGIAYAAFRLKYKEKVYSGVPQVTATVRGKHCYDPRTATTVWTQNPAIIARDYLVSEVGYSTDEIDDTSVIAAANICDQTVAIPTGATQARYQCNTMLEAATEPSEWEENLRTIVDTMRGRAVMRDGKWYLYAGAWEVPDIAIDTADWIGPTTVRASAPPDERWNAVRVWYVDAARDYQRVECYPRRNLGYESADGGDRIWLELELPGVTNEYEAQRHGEFALRASRNQLTVTGTLRPEFFKLATWDTVTVTDSDYGWASKTFRVASMDLTPMGEVSVTLVEEGSATWTDLLEAEYSEIATVFGIDPGLSLPEARTNLVVTPDFAGIGFTWDRPADPLPGEQTRLIEGTVQSNIALGSEVWRGSSTGVILGKTDSTTRFYWIQGIVGSYAGTPTPGPSSGYPAASDRDAKAAISAVLNPWNTALPADYNGIVPDYSAANGRAWIYHGISNVSSNATFDVSSAAGVTGTVNSADNLPWSGQPRGAYRVTACTSDIGILWITATYSSWYGPLPYLLPYTIIKQRSGKPGTEGATSSGIVSNGLFSYVNSDNNTAVGWDADGVPLVSYTGGVNSGSCLWIPNTPGYTTIQHRDFIPVDMVSEDIDVSVMFRRTATGNDRTLYLGFACYDKNRSYLGFEHESWYSTLQLYSSTNSSTIRVWKPDSFDNMFGVLQYGGTPANAMILIPSELDRSGGGYPWMVNSFLDRNVTFKAINITAINTTASSLYDELTLYEPVGQYAPSSYLGGNDRILLGERSSTHKYFWYGTIPNSGWQIQRAVMQGEANPWYRFRRHTWAMPTALRNGTRYVRPFIYSPEVAGGCDVYVDNFIAERRSRVDDPYVGDGRIDSSGRWQTHLAVQSWKQLPITYAPGAGATGAGALRFDVVSPANVPANWQFSVTVRPNNGTG